LHGLGGLVWIIERMSDLDFIVTRFGPATLVATGFGFFSWALLRPEVSQATIHAPETTQEFGITIERVNLKLHLVLGAAEFDPSTWEIQATLTPSGPTQLAGIRLKIQNETLEPLDLHSLNLPYLLERPETHTMQFQIPPRLFRIEMERPHKIIGEARLVVLAGGRTWESEQFFRS